MRREWHERATQNYLRRVVLGFSVLHGRPLRMWGPAASRGRCTSRLHARRGSGDAAKALGAAEGRKPSMPAHAANPVKYGPKECVMGFVQTKLDWKALAEFCRKIL